MVDGQWEVSDGHTLTASAGTSATYVAEMTQTSTGTSLAQSVPVTVSSISASTGWTVSLTTTKSRVPVSTMVQVHAITNQTVSSTGYQIDLIDLSSGSTIKSCTIGTSCFIDITEATAGTHTYLAKVETSTGSTVKAGSPIVTTTWSDETLFLTTPDGTVLGERVSGANDFYLHDALNSVVALVDSSGTIQDSYSYDPYGNVTASTETVPNPFRYAGSIWDSQTGLYKMGARYYDPSIGRFTQQDPSGSGYTYVLDDPTTLSDPTGLCPEDARTRGCRQAPGNGKAPKMLWVCLEENPGPVSEPKPTRTRTPADRPPCGGRWVHVPTPHGFSCQAAVQLITGLALLMPDDWVIIPAISKAAGKVAALVMWVVGAANACNY